MRIWRDTQNDSTKEGVTEMIDRSKMTEITRGVTETSLGVTTMRIWRDAQNNSTEEGVTEIINHSRKDNA